jgi:diphosphomevalonate decarboxylase
MAADQNLSTQWRCPSNIALVKYWGKKKGGVQWPANASLSLNLSDLYAQTGVSLAHGNVSGKPAFDFLLDGQPKPGFIPKLEMFLNRLWDEFSVVRDYHLSIASSNNFPHGTGIASSAAGFGALALCICDLQQQVNGKPFDDFYATASRMARLGSGSACRSVYPGPVIWGETSALAAANDDFAVPAGFVAESPLDELMDAVLIVDEDEKKVSSSAGHALLDANPYSEQRFLTAEKNLIKLTECMQKGNIRSFISIVESEALQLHAMMMVSSPYYILMRPQTLAIIEKIWEFREQTSIPAMFTLDAGANVHLLFPKSYNAEIVNFIENSLLVYCKNQRYLCSATGKGPEKTA